MSIVTVDVWDTLIRRRCHPDAVKLATARFICALFGDRVDSDYRQPRAIVLLRQNIELEIGIAEQKRGHDDEYEFGDVLRRLITRLVGEDHALEEHVQRVVEYELEYECSVTYPDPYIVAELVSLNPTRCYFLSDFYMGADCLGRLLEYHGLDIITGGYSSCDIKLNKRSGRLFDWFVEKHRDEIAKYGYCHVGDNQWSDVEVAGQKGVRAIHFVPEPEHDLRQKREKAYSDSATALAEIIQQVEAIPGSAVERLGIGHAFLYWGFAEHVLHDALAKDLDALYFFTREGEFYQTIYDEINDALPESMRGPSSNSLEVSRVATFFASLREFSTDELMRLWNLYSTQSMASLIKTLGLDLQDFASVIHKHGIDTSEEIVYPWKDVRVQGLFSDSDFQSKMRSRRAERLESVNAYLDSKGLVDSGRVGIVDIGWRGTIQDNLCYLRPGVQLEGYYLGLQVMLNEQPENATKQAFGPDLNKSFDNEELLNAVAPLEMLCNSPNGSVIDYQADGDRIRVSKKIDDTENQVFFDFTAHYQRGVMAGVRKLCEINADSRIMPEIVREQALRIWRDIIKSPHPEIARAYFSLSHNEDFGVGSMIDKSEALNYADLLLAPFSRQRRERVKLFIKNIQWVEGFLHRNDVSVIKKRLLMLLMRAGVLLKKVLVRWRVYKRR